MQVIDKIASWLGFEAKAAKPQYTATMYNQAAPSWASWRENKTFSTVDFVYAVVDKIAKTCAQIPIYGYTLKGEDLPDTDKLAIFLRSLSRKEKYEMFLWYNLRGECFGYKDKIIGVNANVRKIYWLNPSFVSIVVEDNFPFNITGYWYQNQRAGVERYIELDEMIHVYDFNPADDILESKRGLGKIQVLAKRLTKMKSNMDNSVAQMQNGGVPGIVFQKDLQHQEAKKIVDGRRDNFARYLSNSDNKGAPFFAAGEMDYIKLGLSTVELDALKAEVQDENAVCNVFGISARLFNHDGTGSEISDDNAHKALYLNVAMPQTGLFQDEFNNNLVKDFGSQDRKCEFDYADIKVLQEDMLQVANAAAAAPTMVPNEVRAQMGLPRIDDPRMDEVYFKQGYVTLDELGPVDIIEDE